MSLTPGTSVASYEILDSLGVGGMGEVFRARDTRLGREVAIKVLPTAWGDDPEHAKRFEREARTLASLNHPNVAQVYALEDSDGTLLLVLELVEGQDLSERIDDRPLPLEDTLAICRQVADAVAAAHDAGIVHRDLKPGNVRVTPSGVAKVLDFGLAKSIDPLGKTGGGSSVDASVFETVDGALVGTPAYMSPEQVRGRLADRRCDIWAFGCLLYECLTGHPPFEGETLSDTLAAVLRGEPDLSRLPDTVPSSIRSLVTRCLEKDPEARPSDIADAKAALDGDSDAVTVARVSRPRRRKVAIAALFVVAAGLIWTLAQGLWASPSFASRWEQRTTKPLTDYPGAEWDAAIDRDGRYVAFVSDHAGQMNVFLTQLGAGAGSRRNLTEGARTAWFPRVRNLGFDPDGSNIWLGGAGGKERVGAVPLLGGPWKFLPFAGAVNLDWSPDRKHVVYHKYLAGDPIYVAGANGRGEELLIQHRNGWHQHFETWSRDGDWIFLSRGLPTTLEMELWRVRVEDQTREQLTRGKKDVAYPTPLDDDTVLYVARDSNGSGPWLWELDIPSKQSRRVDRSTLRYYSIGASEDGTKLVASVGVPRSQLWRVPIPGPGEEPADESDAEPLPGFDRIQAHAPRFGAGGLFFLNPRVDGDALYRMDGRNAPREILRPENSPLVFSAAVSPDGAALAVALQEGDRMRLHVLDADGSVPRVVSGDLRVGGAAAWSPKGDQIAIGGEDEDGPGLFLVPADGGEPRCLVRGEALNPAWSPDGEIVVYCGPQVGWWLPLLAVRFEDGSSVDLGTHHVIREGERVRFLPDGRGIVYMEGRRSGQDFQLLDPETGEKTLLAQFDNRAEMRTFDIDPTGTYMVFDRVERNSDIVLIDLPDYAE